MLLAYNYNN